MYICICENITDRQLRAEVKNGACSLKQARQACGIASCCGACAREAEVIIDEELQAQVPMATSPMIEMTINAAS